VISDKNIRQNDGPKKEEARKHKILYGCIGEIQKKIQIEIN